jgi:putative transposase
VSVKRLVPNWKHVLQVSQPETLLRWHPHLRAGQVSPRLSPVLADQIARSATGAPFGPRYHRPDPTPSAGNRLWGAERIRGELLKFGVRVAQRTIQKYMRAVRSQSPTGQS